MLNKIFNLFREFKNAKAYKLLCRF
jgi:hypothetical protein